MDLSEPAHALAPGLIVPVLRALSRRSTPASAAQVWRGARRGTLAGVQGTCERLVAHGLVESDEVAGRAVYTLNYDHVLYDALAGVLAADGELGRRMRAAIAEWEVVPVSVVVFGSAARREGDVDSDIDLLVVRPMLPPSKRATWARQLHDLARDVRRWTGNRLQVVDRSNLQVRRLARDGDPIVRSWLADGVTLAGRPVEDLIEGGR